MGRRIINYYDLSVKLDQELSWRRKELTIVKNQIPIQESPIQSAKLRSAVPLLYAHWEGFVKKCTSNYLKFVSNQFEKHKNLKHQFIALSLSKKLGNLDVRSIKSKTKIIDFIVSQYEKSSNIPDKGVINTKSNLTYSVFEEIMFTLDLDSKHMIGKKDLVDDLVELRNYIAHGEYMRVDLPTYLEFHSDILDLMYILKNEIENSSVLKKYLV